MKIILLAGASGSGKTTIAKELCKDNRYNFISSYTDRPMREKNEFGHIFVKANYMDIILDNENIVAQTKISEYRYCSTEEQFDEDKINVYIVDSFGINDTIKFFPHSDMMTILIRRNKIEVDCVREIRDVHVPIRDDVDFVVDNDTKIESAVALIKTLVNFDLFSHPSHLVEEIQDKLYYIDKQYRYLEEIKESLYTQLWYRDRPLYIELCKYVESKVNKRFDFNITIVPDDKPEIIDGYLRFNVIGEYGADLMWEDVNRLVECLSYYAHAYCSKHGYKDLAYHLVIGEVYKTESGEYV